MRIHTREKPFQCSQCGNLFRCKQSKKNYVRIHTGEKPFQYSQCVTSFSCLNNLKSHIKIHIEEKPLKYATSVVFLCTLHLKHTQGLILKKRFFNAASVLRFLNKLSA